MLQIVELSIRHNTFVILIMVSMLEACIVRNTRAIGVCCSCLLCPKPVQLFPQDFPALQVYERAIANIPPAPEKRYWQRYIYLWINYALFEELQAQDVQRTREVYSACLKIIPHKVFTFAKVRLPSTLTLVLLCCAVYLPLDRPLLSITLQIITLHTSEACRLK